MNNSGIKVPCTCNPQNCTTICERCFNTGLVPLESMHNTVCVVCGKELKVTDDPFVIDGVEFKITAGYGSGHDGDVFVGYMCDSCITTKEDSNALRFERNYMYQHVTPEMRKIMKKAMGDK